MTDLVWPSGLFSCPDPVLALSGQSQSGGGTVDGGQGQIVDTSGGGFWTIKWTAQLESIDAIQAAEAWRALLNSGVERVIVPMRQARSRYGGGEPPIFTETDANPADLTFDPTDYCSGFASGTFTSDVTARATAVTLTCTDSIPAGRFSSQESGVWRMYQIVKKGAVSGDDQDFTIRPPLRAAHTTGDYFYLPYCFLTCTVDTSAGIEITYDRYSKAYATLTVTFIEAR